MFRGVQVTVMREPLSHFRSSWRYWGVHTVAKVQPTGQPGGDKSDTT